MNYICPRCLYSCKQKCDIISHIHRKRICNLEYLDIEPILHQDLITRLPGSEIKILREYVNQANKIKDLQEQIIIQKEEIKELKEKLDSESIGNSKKKININIHASDEFEVSLNRMIEGVPDMVKQIHFKSLETKT